MIEAIATTAGGLGLFLLGMAVMTDGLRVLASGVLRRGLARFTRSAWSGALSGAIATALMQSSTATTVAMVGLVNAGVLRFEQAFGLVLGANVGSTVTGWMTVLLGMKLQLSTALMPAVLLGATLRVFGRGTTSSVGLAIAGFGLVFVGIGTLQDGMAGLASFVTPGSLPPDTWLGRLLLVAAGTLLSAVTHSSSSGVAMTLVGLQAGAISFSQGAALVIGMDIGTTSTAALASVGSSVAARRTSFTHVMYNVLSAVLGLIILDPFVWLVHALSWSGEPELLLVTYHTVFNAGGALLLLPFAPAALRWIERLVPERGPAFARVPDSSLLGDPESAVMACDSTLRKLVMETFHRLARVLDASAPPAFDDLVPLSDPLRDYAVRITTAASSRVHARHVALVHVLDHLDRMLERCNQRERLELARTDPELAAHARALAAALEICVHEPRPADAEALLAREVASLAEIEPSFRARWIEAVTTSSSTDEQALARIEALRWLRRVATHATRIQHHLAPT